MSSVSSLFVCAHAPIPSSFSPPVHLHFPRLASSLDEFPVPLSGRLADQDTIASIRTMITSSCAGHLHMSHEHDMILKGLERQEILISQACASSSENSGLFDTVALEDVEVRSRY